MSSPESPQRAGIKEHIGDAARSTTEKVKAQAAEATTRVKEAAGEMVQEQRDQTADRIGGLGDALHETAENIRPNDPNIAWFTEQAASRLQRAADYVRDSSWSTLRDQGARLARNHPVAFYGSMFVLGALASAALKAGVQAATDEEGGAEPETDRPPSATAEEEEATATPVL